MLGDVAAGSAVVEKKAADARKLQVRRVAIAGYGSGGMDLELRVTARYVSREYHSLMEARRSGDV